MNYLFIADVFYEDGYLGGAEVCNKELIFRLKERGHTVVCVHSFFCSVSFLEGVFKDAGIDRIIVGNFLGLSPNTVNLLTEARVPYLIYEHDYKMLTTRDPSVFPDNLAPKECIIYREFYTNAIKVVAQSTRHASIIRKNLGITNIIPSINLWSDEQLSDLMQHKDTIKEFDAAVMGHVFPQKNTDGAIEYCKSNGLTYNLIPHNTPHNEFCRELSKCRNLVFLPKVNETLSRVSVEANCLNAELICNNNISYLDETWCKLRGEELISFLRNGLQETVNVFEN